MYAFLKAQIYKFLVDEVCWSGNILGVLQLKKGRSICHAMNRLDNQDLKCSDACVEMFLGFR